jgi:chaperonin GroES
VIIVRPPLAVGLAVCQPVSLNLSSPTRPRGRHTHEKEQLMKIRPLQDRIIVKRVQEEEKTKGGIIIPDSAKEKPIEGKVLAAGNGKVLEDGKVRPLDIKAGDRVLFSKYAGTEIKLEGDEVLIMREEDVLGVIEG